jgi:uncharacterized protein YbjT (DUF2867 family)
MILVTGATGIAGSEVVRALTARGAPVRAFVRDAGRARERLGDGVELATGDLADGESLRAALAGAGAVVLSCADDPRRVEWEKAAVDAAAEAGVQRIVRLSTVTASRGAPVAFWDWHAQVEEYLRESGVPAVILRSSFYMSNVLLAAGQVASEGRIAAPVGGARIAMVDPRDVGACAAAVLAGEGHDGTTYALTGPEAITYEQVAADLSVATGREIQFVDVPAEAAREGMLAAGMPPFVADQVVAIFEQLRQGAAEHTSDDVRTLTGRRPRSFADFARAHAALFAPSRSPAGAGL